VPRRPRRWRPNPAWRLRRRLPAPPLARHTPKRAPRYRPPPPFPLPPLDAAQLARPRRSRRLAAAAGLVASSPEAVLSPPAGGSPTPPSPPRTSSAPPPPLPRPFSAVPAALPVWVGPDGPEQTPPREAWGEWADPGPPPAQSAASDAPPALPASATASRADLFAVVAAVAADSAAPPTGALWAPPPRTRTRPAPVADALCARAAAAVPPPHQEQALGHTGGGAPAPLSWRRLLSAPTAVTQRELTLPAHAARRARLYADLSGWERTGLAAVQGGRAALWLTSVPSDGGGRGTIPGSAMRVAARDCGWAPPRARTRRARAELAGRRLTPPDGTSSPRALPKRLGAPP